MIYIVIFEILLRESCQFKQFRN